MTIQTQQEVQSTGLPSPQGLLTVTEPKLCSRLALWLSVGDVPWITLRK